MELQKLTRRAAPFLQAAVMAGLNILVADSAQDESDKSQRHLMHR